MSANPSPTSPNDLKHGEEGWPVDYATDEFVGLDQDNQGMKEPLVETMVFTCRSCDEAVGPDTGRDAILIAGMSFCTTCHKQPDVRARARNINAAVSAALDGIDIRAISHVGKKK